MDYGPDFRVKLKVLTSETAAAHPRSKLRGIHFKIKLYPHIIS
ncbi:MAG: hypothetical protein QG666_1131 [Euryarchaeota archaeon]|nr:hypothetical protein [Euryarchaeota archaeon]